MIYALPERIGDPDLFVGRESEFDLFDHWINFIPRRLSKSRVILARRKSGKTALIQRIFNRLWNDTERGVIPFYFTIPEIKTWHLNLAEQYYCTFISQYISYFNRNADMVKMPVGLDDIKDCELPKPYDELIERDVKLLLRYRERKNMDLMWHVAYTAPDRFTNIFDQRILVIIDEFQNISQYIYKDEPCRNALDETLAGSFHDVSESKTAPMLVTGSYVGWLITIMDKYLEAGRLKRFFMNPYLTREEGLQAVYNYAEIMNMPVTNETSSMINRLCMSDPFFISCVIQSNFREKDLTTIKGVINTVNYEITDKGSEMSMNWGEYIELTLKKINDRHAKAMLLHLSKNPDTEWTPMQLKGELNIPIEENNIREKLEIMVKADLIEKGASDIRYKGLQDGTLNLILRSRFEEEIKDFNPDLRQDFSKEIKKLKRERNSLQGRLNNLVGKFAEFQLMTEFRSRKRFALPVYFKGVKDNKTLNIIDARMRYKFQRPDGKEMEIDVMASSGCGRVILVEVKKTDKRTGVSAVRDFFEKIAVFKDCFPEKKVIPAFLSVGGFTKTASDLCQEKSIGTAETIRFYESK